MKTALDLEQMNPALFMDAAQLSRVLLAGAAKVGLANTKTGARQTYQVEVKRVQTDAGGVKPAHRVGPWFVKVHTDESWMFLGTVLLVDGGYIYKPSPKSAFDVDSPEQRGFAFLMRYLAAFGVDLQDPAVLAQMPAIPAPMKVWREAVCARCGEALFSEYVALGFGPTCARAVGLVLPKKPRKKATRSAAQEATTQEAQEATQAPKRDDEGRDDTQDLASSLWAAQAKLQAMRAALPDVDWESDRKTSAWLDEQAGHGRKILPFRRATG